MFQLREVIQDKVYNPPLAVLNRYLFTRKKERTIAGITMPGMLSVYNFHETLIAFLLILVLEFSATILAVESGLDPLTVVVLIIVDFVLAVVAHIPTRRLIIAKNQRIIENDQFSLIRIGKKITKAKQFKFVFSALIVVSAFWKIFFVYEIFGPYIISPLGIFIMVAYLVAAALHLFSTGQFFHSLWLGQQNRNQLSVFKKTNGDKNRAHELRIPLPGTGYIVGPDDKHVPSIIHVGDQYFIDS